MKIIELGIGEKYEEPGLFSGETILFAGMPDDNRFSFAFKVSNGYGGYGINVFFPKDTKKIELSKGTITIHEVTPTKIRFNYEKNS